MDLFAVNELIEHIPADEVALIISYTKRRDLLVADINETLEAKDLPLIDKKGETMR